MHTELLPCAVEPRPRTMTVLYLKTVPSPDLRRILQTPRSAAIIISTKPTCPSQHCLCKTVSQCPAPKFRSTSFANADSKNSAQQITCQNWASSSLAWLWSSNHCSMACTRQAYANGHPEPSGSFRYFVRTQHRTRIWHRMDLTYRSLSSHAIRTADLR